MPYGKQPSWHDDILISSSSAVSLTSFGSTPISRAIRKATSQGSLPFTKDVLIFSSIAVLIVMSTPLLDHPIASEDKFSDRFKVIIHAHQ